MLHAGGERLGESFLTFFETAVGDVLAVVGDSAEDAVEASTDAIGEELVQSDGHGGSVDWWVGGRDVKLIVVMLRRLLIIVMLPGSYIWH